MLGVVNCNLFRFDPKFSVDLTLLGLGMENVRPTCSMPLVICFNLDLISLQVSAERDETRRGLGLD